MVLPTPDKAPDEQRFVPGKSGGADPASGASAGSVVAFGDQQVGQEGPLAHLFGAGVLGDRLELDRTVGSRSMRQAWSSAASAACSVMA